MPCEQMIRIIDYTALNPTTRWEVACLSSGFPPHLWLSHASESAKSTGPARALDEEFLIGCTSDFAICLRTSCTSHIVRCTFIWLTVVWWLVAAVSRHSGLWSSSTHTRDNCPFLPKKITILYRSPTFNLAFAFLLINCTMYKASWPWKLVHPHKRHRWVTTVTVRERERETEIALKVRAIISGHICHYGILDT